MAFKTQHTKKNPRLHTLKSIAVIIGIAIILTALVASIGIAHEQQAQEAATQAQIQKQENDRVEQEKAAAAQKTQASYEKCIQDANASYSEGLKYVPDELYGTARVEAVRLIGEKVEGFKKDCDRLYNKN